MGLGDVYKRQDWNGDGDFDEANEMVANLDDAASPFGTSLPIAIPSTAAQNQNLGVRIRLSQTDNMTPYGLVASGEVEDFLIEIDCGNGPCLNIYSQRN